MLWFAVCLLDVSESTVMLPDFGDDTTTAMDGVRHMSTFDF